MFLGFVIQFVFVGINKYIYITVNRIGLYWVDITKFVCSQISTFIGKTFINSIITMILKYNIFVYYYFFLFIFTICVGITQ